jgi:Mor family transcriptional regulator
MKKLNARQTSNPDIIVDMIQRLAPLLAPMGDAAGPALDALEKDLRATWGGDRAYIPHRRGDVDNRLHSERNSRILRAYQQGRHIAWLSKTEGISERQVMRITST